MSVSLEDFEKKYANEQIIFCEYEKGDKFYFIKAGKVRLVKINEGNENILDILSPGVFFGEMAVIEAEPRSATAIANGNVVLLEFSKENFESVVLQNQKLVLGLIKNFVNRIWTQQQRLKVFGYQDTLYRVIALLLNLKTTSVGDDGVHKVNVGIDDLSKWASVTSSDCKRALQSLSSVKTITVNSDSILINNLSTLERQLAHYAHQKSADSK